MKNGRIMTRGRGVKDFQEISACDDGLLLLFPSPLSLNYNHEFLNFMSKNEIQISSIFAI